jgi:hypothetical protein
MQRTLSGKVGQWPKSRMRPEAGTASRCAGSGSTARRPSVAAKADRRSVDFVFDPRGTNHQQPLLLPVEPQLPSPPRTIVQAAAEPTTMSTPKGKFGEPASNGEKNHARSLASAVSACTPYHLEHSCLRFRRYRLLLYRFLHWRCRERHAACDSVDLDIFVVFFFTPTGLPFLPAYQTSLWWGVRVIRQGSRTYGTAISFSDACTLTESSRFRDIICDERCFSSNESTSPLNFDGSKSNRKRARI